MRKEPILNDPSYPLVSVLIYNHNYGRYLDHCLDSVFTQTYKNIEICFSDNASTDDSWDIALKYARKYPGMVTITRNRSNFGVDANIANCQLNARGKYFILLCSDDVLMPEYVERCVLALESHSNAGFAMVHRTIIDEHGRRTEEPSYYSQSCIIPGPEQAAVFMMEAVNPSVSQVMYRKMMLYGGTPQGMCGTRMLNFSLCLGFPIVYIKEPLLMHRLHAHSHDDSFSADDDLFEIIMSYVLQHQLAKISSYYKLINVIDYLPQSLVSLGKKCLLYCVRSLNENDEEGALRYFNLSAVILPNVTSDVTFKKLQEYWRSDISEKLKILESLGSADNLTIRNVSHDPPPGSIALEIPIGVKR